MHRPSGGETEIMRRRAFIRDTLSAAGLVIAPGVIDSAARLDPVDVAGQARTIAHLEASVHAHALDFPTVPTIDQLPALLRDYVATRHVTTRLDTHLVVSSRRWPTSQRSSRRT